jgi:hypothetical protein
MSSDSEADYDELIKLDSSSRFPLISMWWEPRRTKSLFEVAMEPTHRR